VITAADSGGVLEFVDNDVTGFVADSDPEALAGKIKQWFVSKESGMEMGMRGHQRIKMITWNNVIGKLTSLLQPDRE